MMNRNIRRDGGNHWQADIGDTAIEWTVPFIFRTLQVFTLNMHNAFGGLVGACGYIDVCVNRRVRAWVSVRSE